MIITRAPLRIPLGGGGTDFPSYYEKYDGYILGFAVNLYVYVVIHPTPDGLIHLKYRFNEVVSDVTRVQHPLIRHCIEYVDPGLIGIEIATFTDIPESSGLGGSSAFTVALLKALYEYKGIDVSLEDLFSGAYIVERQLAGQAGGIQDQWFATYGGCHELYLGSSRVRNNDLVFNFSNIRSSEVHIDDFIKGLRLIYTHSHRNNLDIAIHQNTDTERQSTTVLDSLDKTKQLGMDIGLALRDKDYSEVGRIFSRHWENKVVRDPAISSIDIDNLYLKCLQEGAIGGKLLGLGGGGYLLMYTESELEGIDTSKIDIDTEGVKVLYKGERGLVTVG